MTMAADLQCVDIALSGALILATVSLFLIVFTYVITQLVKTVLKFWRAIRNEA